MKPETKLMRQILSALRKRGVYARRIAGSNYQHVGLPDIWCCVDGKLICLEVKTETGRLSKIQKLEIERIRRAGGIAEVVRSVDQAIGLVEVKRRVVARAAPATPPVRHILG